MGHVLAQMIEEKEGFALAGIVNPLNGETLADLDGVDVVIDFSNPANLQMVIAYCEEHKCPAVIATTGFSDEETAQIEALGQKVPVVFPANYSLGINVMKRVVAEITPILEDAFDIEIIEKHHNKKLDAPSGTAKILLSAADPDGSYDHVYGREGNRKRGKEIGIHAIQHSIRVGKIEPRCTPVTTSCWKSSIPPTKKIRKEAFKKGNFRAEAKKRGCQHDGRRVIRIKKKHQSISPGGLVLSVADIIAAHGCR